MTFSAVDNPCEDNECTHLCLLSATDGRGYSCGCPLGFELDTNNIDCIGKSTTHTHTHTHTLM